MLQASERGTPVPRKDYGTRMRFEPNMASGPWMAHTRQRRRLHLGIEGEIREQEIRSPKRSPPYRAGLEIHSPPFSHAPTSPNMRAGAPYGSSGDVGHDTPTPRGLLQ